MRCARVPIVTLALLLAASGSGLAATAAPPPALAALEFDEIDHVYTTEPVPQPGSFRQDAGLVTAAAPAAAATVAPRKASSIFGALSSASTVLSNVGSVVGASADLGRALGIADGVARLAPLTTAMGMAGGQRFDALLQTYVLPRVSPTGAVMLQGFLAAQTEYKARYPARAPAAQTAPPQELAPYAKGTIRHYTVAANGWVRIDDPSTRMALIIKPDAGKTYVVDPASQTVHVGAYGAAASSSAASGTTPGSAAVDDRVEQLAGLPLDGVPTAGFRTRSTVTIAAAGGTCPDATIVSTRLEYFSGYRIGADAANSSPLAQTGDATGCDPKSTVRHSGSNVPADRLLLYQANLVEKKTASGTDRYTVVIERGNVQERSTTDVSAFDVPSSFKRI